MRPALSLILGLLLTVALAACGSDDSSDSESASSGSETVSLEECTPDQLDTLEPDTLTVATDSPAFPPYFEDDDPTNGKGFESAVAYAIADQLGFSDDQVEWVVEPFNSSYAPGPKDFDFDVNQISITEKRAEQVDFSTPYYTANQAVVALKDSSAADAESISDLAGAVIGVQIGTTSLEAVESVIQPDEDPQIFDTSNDVVSALKNGSVEAVVVDVPTAFYLTAVQVPEASVVGQFEAPGGDQFGALLAKDSSLTPCVSAAIEELDSSGELAEIEKQWLSEATNAPVLE
ncbi:amino acid ABC transporter substrate-binding protein [Thermoleophilia bacterium SCSIO 60948]|nr:amino acid ABC transporter substrate-binding protein [Thermoleophilia bacterium SCSIO 60948]